MNRLMSLQMQPNLLQGQAAPSIPAPSTQQVQDAHENLIYVQKMMDGLMKLPDSELNLRKLIESAAETIEQHQISGGKKGIPPQLIAAEMSDPGFPVEGSSAQQIRQFLQKYFDRAVMMQAGITNKFGPPSMGENQ